MSKYKQVTVEVGGLSFTIVNPQYTAAEKPTQAYPGCLASCDWEKVYITSDELQQDLTNALTLKLQDIIETKLCEHFES